MSSTRRQQGEEEEGGHVAVLAFPFATHAAGLLDVTRRLASFTPNTIYSFFSTAKSNASNFTSQSHQHSYANIKAYDIGDGMPEDYVFTGNLLEVIEHFVQAAPSNFTKGIEVAVAKTGRKVSCLVTDAFLWFAADMAKQFQVPWIAVWTSSLTSLSAHFHTDLIRDTLGQGSILGREDETLTFITGMTNLHVGDLPEEVVPGNLTSVVSRMLHKMGKALPEATAVAANSFEELEPAVAYDLKSKLKRILPVGPFNLIAKPSHVPAPDESGCLTWLDKQKPASVAYISFGSVATPPQEELVALADGLESSGVPFLWSLKEHVYSQLPKGFLERVMRKQGLVVPWTPQVDVLSHRAVGVFITHAGWNSLQESMAGGIPMICRPCLADNKITSRMISDVWKVGVSVEGGIFTTNNVARMLKDLVESLETWRRMRENAVAFKQAADAAVGPGGSSAQNLRLLADMLSV